MRRTHCSALVAPLLLAAASAAAATANNDGPTTYVSARVPVIHPSKSLSAVRPSSLRPRHITPPGTAVNTWTKLGAMSGAVVHDIIFVSPRLGYAAAELGQIWQTTDGGAHWTLLLNRGFPYYYYGIYAIGETVIASGFNDSTGEGLLTESHTSGLTWDPDTVLSPNAWAGRIRFAYDVRHALAMNGQGSSGSSPNIAWWSGKQRKWHTDIPDPSGGWFGYQFTLLKDRTAYASGITFCKSADTGATWSCAPPADDVFDGPTQFISDSVGWTGGGEISPDVAGWVHRTTDGGATWSGRVLNAPWPIRQIEFLNKKVGWAAGGNVYSNVGGMYFSQDGGKTWTLDADTGDEMGACSHLPLGDGQTQVWCVGFLFNGSNFASETYSTVVSTP